ncbi:MAG: hypothetical protein ACP5VP_01720 [Candidatus Limnocylindrales bacterium]
MRAGVLVRGAAIVLGPPLDTAWTAQAWIALMLTWVARAELDARWR